MEQVLTNLELPLYRFMLRLCDDPELAADLAQETLMRAWKARATLRDPGAARAWLFRIGVNLWNDRCRNQAQRPAHQPWQDQVANMPDPTEQAIVNELGQAVWDAIDRLPEKQKQVLHLRVLEQMEPKEIADALEMDSQLVRSHLAAARKTLRGLIPRLTSADSERRP